MSAQQVSNDATLTGGAPQEAKALLRVEHAVVDYRIRGRRHFRALDDVSVSVGPGECVGLVGESGSGKSTLGKAILGLAPVAAGRISFDGRDITHAKRAVRRTLASDIQVVFQDPYGSLDPTMTIGEILAEPLIAGGTKGAAARRDVMTALDEVKLPTDTIHRHPSEFSGGQRQRIAIARALIRHPRLIVCDEPTSALDLTTQAAIADLLVDYQEQTGVSFLFISHDLSLVRRMCHWTYVMRSGRIVESGSTRKVTESPDHPYTKRLLLASPVADPERQAKRRAAWLEVRDTESAAAKAGHGVMD